MKKHIYLSLLATIVIFFSCEDNSKFVEQIFTNDEITMALRESIHATIDTTLKALCVVDTINKKHGFYHYDNETYRIELPAAAKAIAKAIVDTLENYSDTISALIFDINRAAELCGNSIKQFWNPVVKEMTFHNPNLVLRGGKNSITNFVKETKQHEFLSALASSILREQFNDLNIITRWNALQEIYYDITENYASIDILTPAAQQMSNGFFRKMTLAEEAIRTYPELRGPTDGLLYKVFGNL